MSAAANRSSMELHSYKAINKGALRGVASLRMSNTMIIHKVMLFAQGNRTWAALPSEPMIDRDGRVMTDANGKRRYNPLLAWPDKATSDRFSAAMVELVRQRDPSAFGGTAAPAPEFGL